MVFSSHNCMLESNKLANQINNGDATLWCWQGFLIKLLSQIFEGKGHEIYNWICTFVVGGINGVQKYLSGACQIFNFFHFWQRSASLNCLQNLDVRLFLTELQTEENISSSMIMFVLFVCMPTGWFLEKPVNKSHANISLFNICPATVIWRWVW